MTLTVKTETGNSEFKLLPPGNHPAICVGIYDFGPQITEFNGEQKEQNKIRLQFEVPDERTTWTDADGNEHEGPMTVGKTYTASLFEKAKLCEHLQSWRGREFTEVEKMGFDLNNILGKACTLTVMHKTHKASGNQWADIIAISPPPKGSNLKPENEPKAFDFDSHTPEELAALPEWMREKVEAGKALLDEQKGRTAPPSPPAAVAVDDNDIPF